SDSLMDFTVKSSLTDATFVIGGRRIHAGKQCLALHSPFFEALLYGDFKERKHDEIVLNDVSYSSFRAMLHLLYHPFCKIEKDSRIAKYDVAILELADRFCIKVLVDRIEQYWDDICLLEDDRFHLMELMQIVDRYRLLKLQDIFQLCSWSSFNTDRGDIKTLPEYDSLSEEAKALICAHNQSHLIDGRATMVAVQGEPVDIRHHDWVARGTLCSRFEPFENNSRLYSVPPDHCEI
ncbi:hypothetical protein PFISCL1PPCAC_22335, partial [Pristionchus fissidentatus]